MPIKLNNGTSAVRVNLNGVEMTTVNLNGILVHRRVTITFNANGGSFGGTSTMIVARTWGVEQITTPSTPFRSGYNFTGWYTSSSGGSLVTFPRATGQSDTTYYARWQLPKAIWLFIGADSSSGFRSYDAMMRYDSGSTSEIGSYINGPNSLYPPANSAVGFILVIESSVNDYYYFYERGWE